MQADSAAAVAQRYQGQIPAVLAALARLEEFYPDYRWRHLEPWVEPLAQALGEPAGDSR
jgi:hypothetical protein